MIKKILLFLLFSAEMIFGQFNLNYFIKKAVDNSPVIGSYKNLYSINGLQSELDKAQNSAFQVYLSSDLLFAPYFNNNGTLFTPNPDPKAIGYDAAVTNGGLYSAQINVDKNIFNGGLLNALKEQRSVQGKSYKNMSRQEIHNLEKQVADQYLSTLRQLLLFMASRTMYKTLTDQLKIMGDLTSKGYTKAQDYLLLKIESKTQHINLEQEWQNYKSGLLQLFSMCGIKDTSAVIIDTASLKISETPPASRFLTQYHLDSLSAAAGQKVFESKYDPQFKLFFNAGLNAVELNDIQRKFGISAGLSFSLPILDGNQKNITRQQTYLTEQTVADYRSYAEKNIFIKRKDSLDKIKSLEKNLSDFKEQLQDYKKVLDISSHELEQGSLSAVEYLTLIRNFIDLQKSKITTEINYQQEISNYNYWNW